jgi:hypothetical protein
LDAAASVDADFVDEGFGDGLDLAGVGAGDRVGEPAHIVKRRMT